ncbi:hypothetical protein [Haloferula sp. A504]|uniref:hypothetical protein n=1 Tax=Haloferula sp. A504 TaxID=3373601 RepID=UPI0031BEBA19|nr:protein-export chaperone SecB [Verrucomicrobiaceae bacterium E54]
MPLSVPSRGPKSSPVSPSKPTKSPTTTMPTPLKASPLTLEHHTLLAFEITASESAEPDGHHSLRTNRKIERHPEDPLKWMVDLTVEIGTPDSAKQAPYSGKVVVRGWFSVSEAYPEERRNALIEVTAASILYGTCREALANFTARSVHGMLSIPSVSFEPITKKPDATGRKAKKAAKKKSASGQRS